MKLTPSMLSILGIVAQLSCASGKSSRAERSVEPPEAPTLSCEGLETTESVLFDAGEKRSAIFTKLFEKHALLAELDREQSRQLVRCFLTKTDATAEVDG